jgi:hypothetical protein
MTGMDVELTDLELEKQLSELHQGYSRIRVHHRFRKWTDHIEYALSQAKDDGLYCEFGVSHGGTLTHMASRRPDKIFNGFDWFRGMPEEWGGQPPGLLDRGGIPPKLPKNTVLHIGLFADTLPRFAEQQTTPVAFMHLDCDLYSSTTTVLNNLGPLIESGTVMVFDDYFTNEKTGNQADAFYDFIRESGHGFVYLSHHGLGGSVALVIM